MSIDSKEVQIGISIIAAIILFIVVLIYIFTKVNTITVSQTVTHPAPGLTCVELVSYKDVAISCVSDK